MTWLRSLRRLLTDDRGGTAVEYGLIIALVVLMMIVALGNFAGASIRMWGNVSEQVVNAR